MQLEERQRRGRKAAEKAHIGLDNIIANKAAGIGDTWSWEHATGIIVVEFLTAIGYKEIAKKVSALLGLN